MLTGLTQLNIELSSRCDRETLCGFCGHQDRKTNPDLKLGDIDFDLLLSIYRQVDPPTIISLHRDGDPLVYPRLGEVLALFSDFPVSIVTHGEALGRRADEIIGNCTTVTVSVIPNDKDRELQIASIKSFLEKKGDRPPMVQLKFVGNVDPAPYQHLNLPATNRSLHNKRGNWTYQSTPLIPEIRVCLDFLGRPTIDWQGNVYACNRLDTKGEGLIGNLNENTLDEIWNGPKRQAMLRAHMAGKREQANGLCATCDYWGIPAD